MRCSLLLLPFFTLLNWSQLPRSIIMSFTAPARFVSSSSPSFFSSSPSSSHLPSQFWKAFSPSVIGLIIALVLCKRMIKCGSSNFTLMKSGCIIGVIGCILLFGWGDMEWSGDQGLSWLYYIGGSFYFMGAGMLTTGCRNCLSRVIERRFFFFLYFFLSFSFFFSYPFFLQ